jgi:hypothetical protein
MRVSLYQTDSIPDDSSVEAIFSPNPIIPVVDSTQYIKKLTFEVDDQSDLEDIYNILNDDEVLSYLHEHDTDIDSMSIGDVVVIENSPQKGAYICLPDDFRQVSFQDSCVEKINVISLLPGRKAKVMRIPNDLENFQDYVKGDIEVCHTFNDGCVIIANESAKINGSFANRSIRGKSGSVSDIVYGPALICATDGENFTGLNDVQTLKYLTIYMEPERFRRKDGIVRPVPYEHGIDDEI